MSLSDFFFAWPFHVATINGLPAVQVVNGLSLSSVAFITLAALCGYFLFRYGLQLSHSTQKRITTYILIVWFVLCSFFFFQRLFQVKAEYGAFSGRSLEQLREATTYGGYYGFIEFVKRYVPRDEGIMLFLPEGADYFNQKTEYYLYPLRIAHNGRYIVVFHAGQTVSFNEQKKTFIYKGSDGKEVILSPVRRIAAYKQEEELYYANR